MSKLEELIEELCPNGVEYVKLKEIAQISAGGDLPKNYAKGQKVPTEQYPYPIYSNGTEGGALYGFTDSYKIEKEAVTISARGTIGYHEVRAGKFTPIVRLITMIADESKITTKFLHYAMYVAGIEGETTGIPSLTVPMLGKFTIPLPPLPVQSEIVCILDKFTELTAELRAELTARKKQYEYYMEKLLNSKDDFPMEALGEIFSTVTDYVAAGSFASIADNVSYKSEPDYAQLVRTMDIKSSFTKGSNVYVDENAFKFLWRVNLNEESIILPNIGVNCGEVYFVTPQDLPYDNNVLGPNAILLRSEKYNNKYLFYLLKTNTFQKALKVVISPGGQTKFNKTELKKLKLPIPSLEEQNRIVALLDRFETLCNDITTGLPAEIEARTKQYEYYRDKLLTFKELS